MRPAARSLLHLLRPLALLRAALRLLLRCGVNDGGRGGRQWGLDAARPRLRHVRRARHNARRSLRCCALALLLHLLLLLLLALRLLGGCQRGARGSGNDSAADGVGEVRALAKARAAFEEGPTPPTNGKGRRDGTRGRHLAA